MTLDVVPTLTLTLSLSLTLILTLTHKNRQPEFDPRIDAQKHVLTLTLSLSLTLTLGPGADFKHAWPTRSKVEVHNPCYGYG